MGETADGSAIGPGRPQGPAKSTSVGPAKVARQLAREFWSIAINAKKRGGRLIDDEPSDAKFYELESEFFEDAAKFDKKPVRK